MLIFGQVISQDTLGSTTLTLKEIESYETDLLNSKETSGVLISIGTSIHLLTIAQLPYLNSRAIITYTLIGVTVDVISLIQYIEYKKLEKTISDIYKKKRI